MNCEGLVGVRETKIFPKDIQSADEFLKIQNFYKGNLGKLFTESKKMNDLLIDPVNGTEFRKKLFNQLFKNHENWGLYERVDFDSFIQLLENSVKNKKIEFGNTDSPEYYKKIAKESYLKTFMQKIKSRFSGQSEIPKLTPRQLK